ncbi:HK97 gp10 family phage protein [Brevundimonas olei]|uniref:HK97 gp10 family phage protein n=1 Tax=Brevundimonas olei TaxID=657642 RepID=UPI0031D23FF7
MRIDVSDITMNLNLEHELCEKAAKEIAEEIGFDLLADLIVKTPVDTGRARNGWEIVAEGEHTVVQNMVPYIGVLNDGHSKQAPANFVESAVASVTRSRS